jgi:hypothetical protein
MDSSSIVVPADFTPELDVSARRSTWRSTSKRLTHEVVSTRLQEGRVEGSSVTVIGCVDGPCLIDAQPIGLRILCHKMRSMMGSHTSLGNPAPVRENQGETIPLVTQVGITFHCDDEGELWPRVEPIFFKDKRHISERVEPVMFLVVSKGEPSLSISPL